MKKLCTLSIICLIAFSMFSKHEVLISYAKGDSEFQTLQKSSGVLTQDDTYSDEGKVLVSEEQFFKDISKSVTARYEYTMRYTNAELNAMTDREEAEFFLECVNAENEFYDKYKNAKFDDLNIQYLCQQYTKGLEKQKKAAEEYLKGEDRYATYTKFKSNRRSGYYNRSCVVVELADYYDVSFPSKTLESMREAVEELEETNDEETRNSKVPSKTVKQVQTLMHLIGFKCWEIDGVAGDKTVKAIRRFQEMYGYEIDGIIDDELINQLKSVADKKGLDWKEALSKIK